MIHIFENYYIQVEDKQFVALIKTEKPDKDGNPVYKQLGYYTTLEAAIDRIRHRMFAEKLGSEVVEVSTVLELLKNLNKQFEVILRGAING